MKSQHPRLIRMLELGCGSDFSEVLTLPLDLAELAPVIV